jgi:hypothetical protein
MEPSTSTASSSGAPLSSGAPPSSAAAIPPTELSDTELLAATRQLVGRSNQLLASLLAPRRGRSPRHPPHPRLRPALLEAVAAGEIHLTGLLMLGPHLTTENLAEVLDRAKHRTKKEIAHLVRQLDPCPMSRPASNHSERRLRGSFLRRRHGTSS